MECEVIKKDEKTLKTTKRMQNALDLLQNDKSRTKIIPNYAIVYSN